MRRIEYQDADEQYMPSPSLRDEAATKSAPVRAIPIPINDNRDEAATQSMRAYPFLRDEAATRPAEKNSDLKKQSQFVPGLMGVTSFLKGVYENKLAGRAEENKANQSQF